MSDDPERKKAYDALYAAIGNPHEIRVWWGPTVGWQATIGSQVPEGARVVVEALIAELSR